MTEQSKQEPASVVSTTSLAGPNTHVERKAGMLVFVLVALITSAVLYLMYARGVFESTQQLILQADDAEGVAIGMDVTFSGFPIGRVRRIELDPQGKALIIVSVASKDAHWLRTTSVFTMERGLVGGTRLRAFSGVLSDPPLEDGATRKLLVGDTAAEIPRVVAAAKQLIQNLDALTAPDSSLDASLHNLKSVTEKLAGKEGALGVLAGTDDNARKMLATIDHVNKLLVTVDVIAHKADSQVFGKDGAVPEAKTAITQLSTLLTEARASLKKVDAVLDEAKAVGANVKDATADLAPLRADVESNLRKVEQLVNEINRKWPFKRDTELKLP